MNKIHNSAYTLLEMSMVIVVISLIAGAIVSGKSLIKNAMLISTYKEMQEIAKAAITFRDIYGGLPGDISNAQSIFGSTDSNGNTISNGNDNGLIDATDCTGQENYSAIQELGLAGLIKGVFLGTGTPSLKTLIPSSYKSTVASSAYWFYSGTIGAVYLPFVAVILSTFDSSQYCISPQPQPINVYDAFAMDTKFDDGLPFTGNFISYYPANIANTCTSVSLTTGTTSAPLSQYTYAVNQNTSPNVCISALALPGYPIIP